MADPEPGKAFCARCQEHKDCGEFHARKNGRPLSYCKACAETVKDLKFGENLERAAALMGGVCADCGHPFPAPVFEFHRGGKVFPISRAKNMSWENLRARLEDHEMLCRNCGAMRKWEAGDA
jgi:hypothetical protein